VFPSGQWTFPDGEVQEMHNPWEMLSDRTVNMKNIGDAKIHEVVNRLMHRPSRSAKERARESLRRLAEMGRCQPQPNGL